MPADAVKCLTVRFMALGHSLHEAKCIAAALVIDCLVISTIMGYRFSDAERERLTARVPETRSAIMAGHCGTVPGSVDRDGILLQYRPDPAQPGSLEENYGIAELRRISSAAPGIAVRVPW